MNRVIRILSSLLILAIPAACTSTPNQQQVNLYTHRHYPADQELFDRFEQETGITVNVVKASADELIKRLELEGAASPADLLITVDAGRLHRATEAGLLQAVKTETLVNSVPAHLRHPQGLWYGLTRRARIVVYAKDRVDPTQLSTYEALAEPQWKGRLLVRSSSNIYNQSLLASIIEARGPEEALAWARGVVANLARSPKGNDRDQVKAIAAGVGDLALINTYYLGLLLNSDNPAEQAAGQVVGVFFPNQQDRGSHVNISGAGVTVSSKNRAQVIQLLEFLVSEPSQKTFANTHYEYPVRPTVAAAPLLESWGQFKADSVPLDRLGELNRVAVELFDQAGWR